MRVTPSSPRIGRPWVRFLRGERIHAGRISDNESAEVEGLIKQEADIEPVIFMLDDEIFHMDAGIYPGAVRDAGADGIVRDTALDMEAPPYGATRVYFGSYFGLDKWVYAEHDWPASFARLVEAQTRRDERRLTLAAELPGDFVAFGWFEGLWGAEQFARHELPFYQKWVPYLQARGKLCALHCDATRNMRAIAPLLRETGVAVIEAYTPPPVGELSVAEALRDLGAKHRHLGQPARDAVLDGGRADARMDGEPTPKRPAGEPPGVELHRNGALGRRR